MPRNRSEIDEGQELETFMVTEYQNDINTVYQAGIVFLEMLSDCSAKRGTYHTVGCNRLFSKYLVTSNLQDTKFYAGGSGVKDLLIELCEEYNWPIEALDSALASALSRQKLKKVI